MRFRADAADSELSPTRRGRAGSSSRRTAATWSCRMTPESGSARSTRRSRIRSLGSKGRPIRSGRPMEPGSDSSPKASCGRSPARAVRHRRSMTPWRDAVDPWSPDGVIVFSSEAGSRGSVAGGCSGRHAGTALQLGPRPEEVQSRVSPLPTGFSRMDGAFCSSPDGHLPSGPGSTSGASTAPSLSGCSTAEVIRPDRSRHPFRDRRRLHDSDASAGSGYLLFRRGTVLMAQAFDSVRRKLSGEAIPVADGVGIAMNTGTGAFTLASHEILAFSNSGDDVVEIVWMNRAGERLAVVNPDIRALQGVGLARGEKRVAYGSGDLPTSGCRTCRAASPRGSPSVPLRAGRIRSGRRTATSWSTRRGIFPDCRSTRCAAGGPTAAGRKRSSCSRSRPSTAGIFRRMADRFSSAATPMPPRLLLLAGYDKKPVGVFLPPGGAAAVLPVLAGRSLGRLRQRCPGAVRSLRDVGPAERSALADLDRRRLHASAGAAPTGESSTSAPTTAP